MDAGLGHAFPRFLALLVRKVRQLDWPVNLTPHIDEEACELDLEAGLIRNGADQAVIALVLLTGSVLVDDRFALLDALLWSALLPCDDQSCVARSAGLEMEAVSHHR